jgi:hypothetical protein
MNPVIFHPLQTSSGLTTFSTQLSEFRWKNQLVGLTDSGFLYVDERVPRKGFYEFPANGLPWDQVEEVCARRRFAILGVLAGVGILALGFCAFMAGWVNKTHVGPGTVTLPIACGIGGVVLVLGGVRNEIVVRTAGKEYRWLSGPLSYKRTLKLCQEAQDKARAHGVQRVSSHC